MNRCYPNFALVLGLLFVGMIALALPLTPVEAGIQRNIETVPGAPGATVTALLRERDSILATLTASPKTPATLGSLPTQSSIVTVTSQVTSTSSLTFATRTPTRAFQPTVSVIVDGLNIRSGPGVNYPIIGSAKLDAKFLVAGQANNCGWLNIADANGPVGWISGAPSFVQFDSACTSLVVSAIPPTPTPRLATPTPRPSTVTQGATGCYLLQNQLGFELVINLQRDDGWSDTIRLPVGGEQLYCAAPATYSYTMTAPPPLGSINGTIVINAGDRFSLPLRLPNR